MPMSIVQKATVSVGTQTELGDIQADPSANSQPAILKVAFPG
jgi:hypothetical protein